MTTSIISLGAINKITGEYVYPKIANKKDLYICPECNKDLILCQGDIRIHHFRHKNDGTNPCNHYNHPTESQIHKDAKMLLKKILEQKIPISFTRNFFCCKKKNKYEIPEISDSSSIQIEFRFEHNGTKIADVAYIDNKKILYIFEICNTHKTKSENRPEPWFEIDAINFIKMVNESESDSLTIECIRSVKCEKCIKNDLEIQLSFEKLDKTKISHENVVIDNSKKQEPKKKKTCFTCGGSGTSYWSDGCYGSCLDCCCINCGKFNSICECIYCEDCNFSYPKNHEHICEIYCSKCSIYYPTKEEHECNIP